MHDHHPGTYDPTKTSRRPKPSRVCFGHKTALQMLRATKKRELASVRSKTYAIPERPPNTNELQRDVEKLALLYPAISFEKPFHVIVSSSACRASDILKPHVHTKALPNNSLLKLSDDMLFTTPELTLIHMAAQLKNEISLFELAWEMCGSYQTRRTGVQSAYDIQPLTNVAALRNYLSKNPSLRGAQKVARILPYLADGSASARETKLALILGLPLGRGGYGLGIPRMNYKVWTTGPARAISGRRSLRCDLGWPSVKVDVEYQSRESHEGEPSRIRDSRRTNALLAMGWTVIGITNNELDSLTAIDTIAKSVRQRIGKREQMRIADHHARKVKLRYQLCLPTRCE